MDDRAMRNDGFDGADHVYLRSEVKVEPLSARWYAWSHLLSPVQHALNIAFRQLPMLQSFISNPGLHARAAQDPKFLCAPFMHLTPADVPAVRALLVQTQSHSARLIQLAHDLMQLSRQLRDGATGFSVEQFYRALPESLAGLVEITYDASNHPALRVLEELVYLDGLDDPGLQELSFFSAADTERPFFLNTPRLASPSRIDVQIPFADERLDELAASRIQPVSFSRLADSLQIGTERRERFREFFSSTPPVRKDPNYSGDAVRVRYLGHACVLVQTSRVSILIDPVVAWDAAGDGRFTFNDLPDFIDYVFLTHNHQDHMMPEVLLQLRKRIGTVLVPGSNSYNIADASVSLLLQSLGFKNVQVLSSLQELTIPDGRLVALPSYGEHADLSIASKHGLFLDIKGHSIALLADADCVDRMLYRRLARAMGKVDLLFIGMECAGAPLSWLYGPYLTDAPSRKDDESRRLSGSDCERAWAVVEEFGCAQAFVYAMGQEPWLKHILGLQYTADSKQMVESDKFVSRCREAGIGSDRLYGAREMVLAKRSPKSRRVRLATGQ